MAAPAGFAGQLMYKSEVTAGTAVTVDKALDFTSESMSQEITRLRSAGIHAGRRTGSGIWKAGAKTISGTVNMELPTADIASLLTSLVGSVSTAGSDPYTHTIVPNAPRAFTLQIGRPDIGGTVDPFTYAGCKCKTWRVACGIDEIATLSFDLVGMSETTVTALATASYAASQSFFVFTEGALTIAAGAVTTVRSFDIGGDNKIDPRHRLGSATSKEPLSVGAEYGGTLSCDFESLTAYNRFVNGTEAALVLTFTSGTDVMTITTNVVFNGTTPNIGGADELLEQPLPFICSSTTSDAAALTISLVNNDASAA